MHADTISIINHTKKTLFVGLYEVKSDLLGKSIGDAKLISSVVAVPPKSLGGKGSLSRPLPSIRKNLILLFSEVQEGLLPELNIDEYKSMTRIPANWLYFSPFHIIEKNGVLHGYDFAQWQTASLRAKAKSIKTSILKGFSKKMKHTYASSVANVRLGNDLAVKEIEAVEKRSQKAKIALEELLDLKFAEGEMPRIAVVMSGGGMRAATCAEGFFAGLEDIKLLDGVLYAAALSGSTWFLSNYLMFGKPLDDYKKEFMKAITEVHLLSPEAIAKVLWQKVIFEQPIGIIDIYGVFLANMFFRYIDSDKARQRLRFSSLVGQLQTGDWVFPLCTAVETTFGYHWFTFSPYEIGSETLGAFVPTWSFGRKFSQGKSINYAYEQSLGFFMGVWGSAVSGSVYQLLKALDTSLPSVLEKLLDTSLIETGIGRQRVFPVKVFNPFYGSEVKNYKNLSKMTLIDAGYAFNLPFPPVLNKKRKIDVIIVMDASGNVHKSSNELKKAEQYARENNYLFPPINYEGLTERAVSIFKDENNAECPVIIYIVPQVNKKYPCLDKKDKKQDDCFMGDLFAKTYTTATFTYKGKNVEWLIATIRQSIKDYKKDIVAAIRDKSMQKKQRMVIMNPIIQTTK
jgi:hypothetical protein